MPKSTTKSKPVKVLRGGLDADTSTTSARKASRSMQQQLARRLQAKLASVCSGRWHDDVQAGHTDYPVPGMVLGRAKVLTTGEMVSNNKGRIGTRRYTPPGGVGLEDMLDEMSINRATAYVHPPAICLARSRPEDAPVYDPREAEPKKYTLFDTDASIFRCVKLGAFVCHAMPEEPLVESYVQVMD